MGGYPRLVVHRPDIAWLIRHYGLTMLPVESIYLARTYTSPARSADGSAAGSAIIGLLSGQPQSRSLLHRVACDEMWHAYGGDPFRLLLLHPDGSSEDVVMGSDIVAGQRVQLLVPAGTWQAAELVDGGQWALFGCTVAPEFTSAAFEGGHASELVAAYPHRRDDIERLAVPEHLPTELPVAAPPEVPPAP